MAQHARSRSQNAAKGTDLVSLERMTKAIVVIRKVDAVLLGDAIRGHEVKEMFALCLLSERKPKRVLKRTRDSLRPWWSRRAHAFEKVICMAKVLDHEARAEGGASTDGSPQRTI